jgi:glycine/D-amino acid oxidase-like deaminating enzyme
MTLAAARHLAENRPNEKIVVVEAGEYGENASGRNSGFVIDVPHTISSNLGQLENAHRHMRLARTATENLLIRQDIKLNMQQHTSASKTQEIRAHHLQILRDRFPAVPNVSIDNTWAGYICMSRNSSPAFGEVAPNA